jgi:hypothetical protein
MCTCGSPTSLIDVSVDHRLIARTNAQIALLRAGTTRDAASGVAPTADRPCTRTRTGPTLHGHVWPPGRRRPGPDPAIAAAPSVVAAARVAKSHRRSGRRPPSATAIPRSSDVINAGWLAHRGVQPSCAPGLRLRATRPRPPMVPPPRPRRATPPPTRRPARHPQPRTHREPGAAAHPRRRRPRRMVAPGKPVPGNRVTNRHHHRRSRDPRRPPHQPS